MYDPTISIGAILCVLLSVLLAHRLAKRRDIEKEYNSSVKEFKNLLVLFLRELEHPDANPAVLVTQHFPEHDEAARKLINVLPSSKSKKFQEKWAEYQFLYQQKKSMGIAIAIAAEVDDLSKANNVEYLYEQNAKRRTQAFVIVNETVQVL